MAAVLSTSTNTKTSKINTNPAPNNMATMIEYVFLKWDQMQSGVYIMEITADLMMAPSVATDGCFEHIH